MTGTSLSEVMNELDTFLIGNGDMRTYIEPIKAGIGALVSDGCVKLYSKYKMDSSDVNKLKYVCIAVRKYNTMKGDAYDYISATYSYETKSTVNQPLFGLGCGFLTGGVILLSSFLTGGVAGVLLLAIGSITVGGSAMSLAHSDAKPIDFSSLLEATFLYKLVQEKYAVINNSTKCLQLTF